MQRLVLLLVLLGVDWYFDTSFGTSPFDRPMSSTEAVCKSLAYKQDIQQKFAWPELQDAAPITFLDVPPLTPLSVDHEVPASILPDSNPIFAFMSMQC